MKFTDELSEPKNRAALKHALANWMLGFDDESFATAQVVQCIPWDEELNAVIPWEEVDYEFDVAIGSRGDWNHDNIVFENEEGERLRRDFWKSVEDKCDEICRLYTALIAKANGRKEARNDVA